MERYFLLCLISAFSLWPETFASQLGRRQITLAKSRNLLPRSEFICPTPDGNFPVHGQCTHEYYSCVDGVSYVMSCPELLLFDPVTIKCETSELVSCNQKFDCPNNGIYPYPDACTSLYYVCSSGISTIEYCPEGYVFDPISLKCVAANSASCAPTTTEAITTTTETTTSTTELTSPPTTETTVAVTEPFTCPGDGLYPISPDACSPTYYECVDGVPNVQSCTGTSIFNPLTQKCEAPNCVPTCAARQHSNVGTFMEPQPASCIA